MTKEVKEAIETTVSNFAYFHRKEDTNLTVDDLREMYSSGELSVDEMVKEFKSCLIKELSK